MIVFVFSRYSKKWDNQKHQFSDETIIVEACGTDSIFRPDQRKTFFNMKLDAFNYLKRLKGVNKYDLMRAHQIESYRDITDVKNAVNEYIKLDYENSLYLK